MSDNRFLKSIGVTMSETTDQVCRALEAERAARRIAEESIVANAAAYAGISAAMAAEIRYHRSSAVCGWLVATVAILAVVVLAVTR